MKRILISSVFLLLAISVFPGAASASEPKTDAPCPPPPPSIRQGQPGRGNDRITQFLSQFDAAEQARLRKLAETDPKAFRQEVFRFFEAKRQREIADLMKLRAACLNAKTEAEQNEAKAALRAKITGDYQRHLANSERRINEMEAQIADFQKRLERFKAEHKKRQDGADEFIEKTFQNLTDPTKEPEFPPPPRPRQGKGKPGRDFPPSQPNR